MVVLARAEKLCAPVHPRLASVPLLAPSTLRAIVFDVDGTLYRQGPVRRAMLARLVGECLRRPVAGARTLRVVRAYRHAQEEMRARGASAGEQLRVAQARTGLPASFVNGAVARWMEQEPLALLPAAARAGMADFLAQAEARGLRLGVLSDYPAHAKLAALGVAHRFTAVVSAQDPGVGTFKPDPRGLLLALERLGVPPAQALYVGDRAAVDGVTAARAGVAAVIVGRRAQRRPADDSPLHVDDYAALARTLFGEPRVA